MYIYALYIRTPMSFKYDNQYLNYNVKIRKISMLCSRHKILLKAHYIFVYFCYICSEF